MKKNILITATSVCLLGSMSVFASTTPFPSKSEPAARNGWVAFAGPRLNIDIFTPGVSPVLGAGYQFNRYLQLNFTGSYLHSRFWGNTNNISFFGGTVEGLLPVSQRWSLLADTGVGYAHNFSEHLDRIYVPVNIGVRYDFAQSFYSDLKIGACLTPFVADDGNKSVGVLPNLSLLFGYRF